MSCSGEVCPVRSEIWVGDVGISGGDSTFFWLGTGVLIIIVSKSSLTHSLVSPSSRHRFCRSDFWCVFKNSFVGNCKEGSGHFATAQFEVADFQET